jgi:hypothetical protein
MNTKTVTNVQYKIALILYKSNKKNYIIVIMHGSLKLKITTILNIRLSYKT